MPGRQQRTFYLFPARIAALPINGEKMPDPRSMSVAQLQRAITKISTRMIGKCASMDELDQAWATLCRLQDALAIAAERAKGLADD